MDIISTTMNIEVETNNSNEEDWYVQHVKLVKSKNYQDQAFKLVCEEINIIFPNYLEDKSFGGEKKFIKINLIDNEYHVRYINPELKSLIYSEDGDVYIGKEYYENFTEQELMHKNLDIICEDIINFAWNEELNYFHMLLENQFIIPNEIYDLQSNSFTRKISKTKMNINIQNYDDFINTHNMVDEENTIYNRIYKLLCYNFAINDKIYGSINTDEYEKKVKIKDFGQLYVDIGMMRDINMITLHKINKKYYDYKSFFRKYTPYRIRWDDNNNYYMINRDYEYIGLNSQPKYKCIGDSRLFDDGSKPWENRADYIQFCNEYNKIVRDHSLKDCLNMHNSTITILTLLD